MTDYLLGPSGGETPHEYLMRLTDRVDEPVRSPQTTTVLMGTAWRNYFERKRMTSANEIAAEILAEVADIESAFVATLKIRDIIAERGLSGEVHDSAMELYNDKAEKKEQT